MLTQFVGEQSLIIKVQDYFAVFLRVIFIFMIVTSFVQDKYISPIALVDW